MPISSRLRRVGAVASIMVLPAFVAGQNPATREAVAGRITKHVENDEMAQALSAYDAYAVAAKKPDLELLRPIAIAELNRAARTYPDDRVLFPAALERLARAGDAAALQKLKRAASGSPPWLEALASLARLGDTEAGARLGELLKSATAAAKVETIRAVEDAGARSQAAHVAALLNDPDVNVRIAAARAVGALEYRAAIPQLRALMERDVAVVRMFAAPSLKRLGDTSADAHVAKMLASDSPDMRLAAAQGYPRSPRAQWLESVKNLRADRDPLARVRAAGVLACCDPAAARGILNEALADPLPPMRLEAARVYELNDLADAATARRLLGDSFDQVRLYGAGAVLRRLAKRVPQK